MVSRSTYSLPERRRNYRFALTPLADAMFQLLIFFMLSSGLTPYSLLSLQSAPGTGGPTADGASETGDANVGIAGGDVALWTVDAEAVIVGGQRFGFDALDELAAALGGAGEPANVVLVTRPGARVQDLTTVLARLRAAQVGAVRVATGGG